MYCTKAIILLLIFAIQFEFIYGQTNQYEKDSINKVNWLKANAVKIRSIDSTDEDFSDLMPLKNIIGDAKIVMLGEQTHVDGATYLAKTRLIKFLHKEMGFSVLAFETGFYDVARAWQSIKKGKSVDSAFKESVYFAEFKEYQPLIQYIQRNVATNTPLEMVGFDHNITHKLGQDSFLKDIRTFFNKAGVITAHFEDTSFFAKQLVNMVNYKSPEKSFFDTLNKLTKIVDSITTVKNNQDNKFFLQVLKSIKKAGEGNTVFNIQDQLTGDDKKRAAFFSINIRDAQMADNLLWYVNSFYRDRKIIVWAANFHVAAYDIPKTDKEFSKYTNQVWRDSMELFNTKPMGSYVKEKLGAKAYIIAFTAYSGSFGVKWKNGESYAVPIAANQRPELELEELINAAAFDFAFVDVKKPAKGGEWLRKTIIARPLSNIALKGEWHKAVDGFFYIKHLFGVRE